MKTLITLLLLTSSSSAAIIPTAFRLRTEKEIVFELPATGQEASRNLVVQTVQIDPLLGELNTVAGTVRLLAKSGVRFNDMTNDRGYFGFRIDGKFHAIEPRGQLALFDFPGIEGQIVGHSPDAIEVSWPVHAILQHTVEYRWDLKVDGIASPVTNGVFFEHYEFPLLASIPVTRDGGGNITSWGSPYAAIHLGTPAVHATPSWQGNDFVIYSTPEPASCLLLVLGAGIWWRRGH